MKFKRERKRERGESIEIYAHALREARAFGRRKGWTNTVTPPSPSVVKVTRLIEEQITDSLTLSFDAAASSSRASALFPRRSYLADLYFHKIL